MEYMEALSIELIARLKESKTFAVHAWGYVVSVVDWRIADDEERRLGRNGMIALNVNSAIHADTGIDSELFHFKRKHHHVLANLL
tara:strand:+ start:276 stop:530 length:255 start_codon:yes stop_codon:yes gene_type:complete